MTTKDEILVEEPSGATSIPPVESSEKEEFAKTATAAKLSGTYHKTAGFFKRKLGELTGDDDLQVEGRNEQILGKVHRLVGTLRGVKEAAVEKINKTRTEGQVICRKHGGKLLDVASDFVTDIKNLILK